MIAAPYLLFLGDGDDPTMIKTAYGLRDWVPEKCIGQHRLPSGTVDLDLTEMNPMEAAKCGARTMVIGVANIGGFIPDNWIRTCQDALEAGLDIAAGLHERLAQDARLKDIAARHGRVIHDVRFPPSNLPIATGRKRPGRRLLTVGSDCALGKKYTALCISRALSEAGYDVDFRATGQTGILIAGAGIAIDSVVSDFAAGAAEVLSPAADENHWDIIEGQGAISHPAYSGVTLALLHGSQPDYMVLCHDPKRRHINRYPEHPIWPLPKLVAVYEELARATNPDAKIVGISLNTSRLDDRERAEAISAASDETGLPAGDPMVDGLQAVVTSLIVDAPLLRPTIPNRTAREFG